MRCYAKANLPPWQPLDRVLDAFRLSHERRGRVSYVAQLEARAAHEGGKIGEQAMEVLRRGCYLGEDSFKDKLLGMLNKAGGLLRKKR